jgi:predicted  nucleic acid-binding Zn-ribbon protein
MSERSDYKTISFLEQNLTEKNLELTKMKQKIAIMNSNHKIETQRILMQNSEEINALLQKFDEIENSNRINCDSYQTKFKRFCKQIESMETALTAKEVYLRKFEKENEAIKQSFESIKHKVEQLETDMLLKDKIVNQQNFEIFELQQSLGKKSDELDDCSKNLLEAHQKLLNLRNQSEQSEVTLTNELLKVRGKVQSAFESVVEKQEMLQSLERENDQIKHENQTLKKDLKEVEEIAAGFERKNKNLISLTEELAQMVTYSLMVIAIFDKFLHFRS